MSNGVKGRTGSPGRPTTYRRVAMGYQRGRRIILRGRRGIWRPAGRPKGAPTKLSDGLALPDPQQHIGCQMWALDVAGVVFGGQ